jgi:hypothetical protein
LCNLPGRASLGLNVKSFITERLTLSFIRKYQFWLKMKIERKGKALVVVGKSGTYPSEPIVLGLGQKWRVPHLSEPLPHIGLG